MIDVVLEFYLDKTLCQTICDSFCEIVFFRRLGAKKEMGECFVESMAPGLEAVRAALNQLQNRRRLEKVSGHHGVAFPVEEANAQLAPGLLLRLPLGSQLPRRLLHGLQVA